MTATIAQKEARRADQMRMQRELILGNYKEPLLEVEEGKGFGYYGALRITPSGDGVQCHLCGLAFPHLSFHLRWAHEITAKEYRKRFKLSYHARLISEKFREAAKQRRLAWQASLTPEARAKMFKELAAAGKKALQDNGYKKSTEALEVKNKKGTCPDQLLVKIKEAADALGHQPSFAEFNKFVGTYRYINAIRRTFGTWGNALAKLGYKSQRQKKFSSYEPEELLIYLKEFAARHHTTPTNSDCARGLIPSASVYKKHFGGIVKARAAAGLKP